MYMAYQRESYKTEEKQGKFEVSIVYIYKLE